MREAKETANKDRELHKEQCNKGFNELKQHLDNVYMFKQSKT